MQISAKQKEALDRALTTDKKLIVNTGAVGAGKTFVDNTIFLAMIDRAVEYHKKSGKTGEPLLILAGYSQATIQNNVLTSLQQDFDLRWHTDRDRRLHLRGATIVVVGGSSKSSVASVRGLNAYGAYINEASKLTAGTFDEIYNRVRVGDWQKVLIDTNPSSPNSWLNKKWLSRRDDDGNLMSEITRFSIFDNPFLPKEYVEDLAQSKKGADYSRDILGLDVDDGNQVLEFSTSEVKPNFNIAGWKRLLGLDWSNGGEDPTVLVEAWTNKYDAQGRELARPILWLGRADFYHKLLPSESWRVLDNAGIKPGADLPVIADSANAGNNAELLVKGYNVIPTANKVKIKEKGISVLRGYDIIINSHLDQALQEWSNYSRDDAGKIKDGNDHSIDALRYAVMYDYYVTNFN
jgi:hypothetical protein